MAARSLDQILAELGSVYNPQIDSLRQRQSAIPEQVRAEEQGLQAKQGQAFDDILAGARRRGVGIAAGGIPLAEQARYTSTEFLPALARLRQSGQERAMSLEDAINGIYERRNNTALGLQQQDWQRDFQERQFAEQQAAARRAASIASPTLGGSAAGGNKASATASQRADKGFNFTDANGNAISAAAYAAAKNIPFRTLLQQMANAGDKGAGSALGFVGDDYGYDANKVRGNNSLIDLYNSLVWGTNRNANGYRQVAKGGW